MQSGPILEHRALPPHTTALPHYRITALPHYRTTALPRYRTTSTIRARCAAFYRARPAPYLAVGVRGLDMSEARGDDCRCRTWSGLVGFLFASNSVCLFLPVSLLCISCLCPRLSICMSFKLSMCFSCHYWYGGEMAMGDVLSLWRSTDADQKIVRHGS